MQTSLSSEKPRACFAKHFPLNVLRACELRWKFNLHVHLHITHQNILNSPLKSVELFQSILWKLFKHFGGFHRKLCLAKTRYIGYWTFLSLLNILYWSTLYTLYEFCTCAKPCLHFQIDAVLNFMKRGTYNWNLKGTKTLVGLMDKSWA